MALLCGCAGHPTGDDGSRSAPAHAMAAPPPLASSPAALDRFRGRIAMPTVPPGFLRAASRPAGGAPQLPANAPAPADTPLARSDASPAIVAATIAPAVVHNGEAMTWSVRTTGNVVAVTAHVSMYALPLRRVGDGRFALSFTVPSNVPGIFHGTYDLSLVATAASGATATRTLPLVFR